MKETVKVIIFVAAILATWAISVRMRYSPAGAPGTGESGLEMPSFRPLSPYPLVTEIIKGTPRPTINPRLVCPEGMVKIDNFCIDRYEFPNRKGGMPKVYVTWLQAQDACKKVGKRLCREDEWVRACDGSPSGGALRRFSYADTFILTNCNIQNTKAVASGSFSKCKSAWGVYDMVGNVYEWVQPEKGSKIFTLGGAWGEGQGASCYKGGAGYQPNYYQEHIGFRCCK